MDNETLLAVLRDTFEASIREQTARMEKMINEKFDELLSVLADNSGQVEEAGLTSLDVIISDDKVDEYSFRVLVTKDQDGEISCQLFEVGDGELPSPIEGVEEEHLNIVISRIMEKVGPDPHGWFWANFVQYTDEPVEGSTKVDAPTVEVGDVSEGEEAEYVDLPDSDVTAGDNVEQ